MQTITLVNLKRSYAENRPSTYVDYFSIEEAMPVIVEPNTSTLEVLRCLVRRIYMDVEKIPYEREDLIYEIVNKFCEFIGISNEDYTLTYNNASQQHHGRSYHVIFPHSMYYKDLGNIIKIFKKLNPEYISYVDESVYDINRLFRLPMNGKVTGSSLDYNDKHVIIKGTMESAIIQNVVGIPFISAVENEKISKLLKEHAHTLEAYKRVWKCSAPSKSVASFIKSKAFKGVMMTNIQKILEEIIVDVPDEGGAHIQYMKDVLSKINQKQEELKVEEKQ